MQPTQEQEWRSCTDPVGLSMVAGDHLGPSEQLLVLTGFTRPLWAMTDFMPPALAWAMNNLENRLYRYQEQVGIQRIIKSIDLADDLLAEHQPRLSGERIQEHRRGDWYASWEIGNQWNLLGLHRSAVSLCRTIANWAETAD